MKIKIGLSTINTIIAQVYLWSISKSVKKTLNLEEMVIAETQFARENFSEGT